MFSREGKPQGRLRGPWQGHGAEEGSDDRDTSQGPTAPHFQLQSTRGDPWSTGDSSAQLGSARWEGLEPRREQQKERAEHEHGELERAKPGRAERN